ncbi:hypothetical protein SESBI_29987 [Sesbania bispinosa]|nr:hypothetical protein SESBI_29987 [Sesbania bispinosa]
MAVAAYDLRRDVLLGADEGVGAFAVVGETRLPSTHRADSGGLGLLKPVFVLMTVVRREEGDPTRKIPAVVFAARLWRLGIRKRQRHWRRSNGFGGFWGEFAREIEIVSVSDAHGMKVVESAENLSKVETDDRRGENAVVLAVTKDVEVTTGAVREGPSEKLLGLECAENGREERVGEGGEDLDFPPGTAFGVEFGVDGGFVYDLESERGGCGGVVDEEDGAHSTFAEDFDCSEVVKV